MAEGPLNARERIDRRRFGEPMKRALRRVLNGESYRQAVRISRHRDHPFRFKLISHFGRS
jgi:hypothetical protein